MDILELLHYTFFRHALLGSLFASIACGIIGTYIVTRRLVFISGGITHASFGGIGLGLYAGISPLLSAAVFSVLSAFGVEWLSKRKDMREDSAIAVFWTFGMAVGIIFSFLAPGFTPDLSAFLFGNILTITPTDIWMLATLSVLLILFFTLFLNPIIYIAFDREFARCPCHLTADVATDDRQPVHSQFQAHHLAFHRYRIHRLPGRTGHFL